MMCHLFKPFTNIFRKRTENLEHCIYNIDNKDKLACNDDNVFEKYASVCPCNIFNNWYIRFSGKVAVEKSNVRIKLCLLETQRAVDFTHMPLN